MTVIYHVYQHYGMAVSGLSHTLTKYQVLLYLIWKRHVWSNFMEYFSTLTQACLMSQSWDNVANMHELLTACSVLNCQLVQCTCTDESGTKL